MNVNALLEKYEGEIDYHKLDGMISVRAATTIVRLAVKEMEDNAMEGWRAAAQNFQSAIAESVQNGILMERVRQLKKELAQVRQSHQKEVAAKNLALLDVERLELEASELRANLASKDSYVAGQKEHLGDAERVRLLERENEEQRDRILQLVEDNKGWAERFERRKRAFDDLDEMVADFVGRYGTWKW